MPRGALFCARCGAPQSKGVQAPLDLLIGTTRVPLTHTITLGRGTDNDVTLADPSVSRHHARVVVTAVEASIEDAGSSHGTVLDERPLQGSARLREGSVVRLGNTVIRVERRPEGVVAGRTMMLGAAGFTLTPGGDISDHAPVDSNQPRLRPGCALKELGEDEGDRRWVLRDESGDTYLRMGDAEARLIQLLASGTTLEDLLAASDRELGPEGPARLARLLADLGEHGMLERTGGDYDPFAEQLLLERVFKPREWEFSNPDRWFQAVYRWGGWLAFTTPGLLLLAAVAVCGLGAFGFLMLAGHRTTPFVVGGRITWGAAVFILGRLAVVTLHEIGHGLTVASFGRRIRRAGVKLVLIFPFGFVDTSDAWFEPRMRRIAVSAAGPVTDTVCAGAAALVAASATGVASEIAFQIALGAYVGALFNLNPLLDRDGYHILVDLLREPGLRARSRRRLQLRLAGRPVPPELSRITDLYALAALAWLLGCACFAIVVSIRYYDTLVALTSHRQVVWALFGIFYAMLFLPIVLSVGRPLMMRRGR